MPATSALAVPADRAARRADLLADLRGRLAAAGLDEFVDLDEIVDPHRPIDQGRDGSRSARRLVVAMAVALLTVAGLLTAGGTYLFQRYTASISQEPLLGAAAAGASGTGWSAAADAANGPATGGTTGTKVAGAAAGRRRGTNVLLVGIDERAGSPATDVRADTVMIAHLPASGDRVYLVSVPRDSRVTIPAYPRAGYRGGVDKVNTAYQIGSRAGGRAGGVELLGLTLRSMIGVGFDAAAIVNFEGLRAAVDAVGGVDLCVDEETTSIHVGWDIATGRQGVPYTLRAPNYDSPQPVPGMRAQVYHVGCQHFVGWQALDYVRQRELIPDGDYGRQRHQQQLIKALAEKVNARHLLANPTAADRMLRALGSSVTFDGNGTTLTNWILAFRHLDASTVTIIKTNGGHFASQVIGGRSFEILSGTMRELFTAMRTDTVADFLTAHPDWVGR